MIPRRVLGRAANKALGPLGLRLIPTQLDFQSRSLDEPTINRMCGALSTEINQWLARQTVLPEPCLRTIDQSAIRDLYEAWLNSPFRTQSGGTRFNNMLWLYTTARAYNPTLIIDSGTFQGASAWALKRACPNASVLSFDIDLSNVISNVKGIDYIQGDFSCKDLQDYDCTKALAYFDDHLDQVKRLIQAAERGIGVALFDDDYPVTSFAQMAPDAHVLPKIEFVLDDTLVHGTQLKWMNQRGHHTFTVDRAYLDRAKALILETERLPNTSLITGIHQTPYRIVALA